MTKATKRTRDPRPGRALQASSLPAFLVIVGLLCSPSAVFAQPDVDQERQDRAQALYEEGVKLHQDLLFAQAVEKYRAALEEWDHPHTRFNLSKALGALGRHLEAYDNLSATLPRLGPDAEAGEAYLRKLMKSLAEVEVSCDEDGAKVTLDSKPVLTCPGQASRVVEPGNHVLVASKSGYATATEPLNLVAGKKGVVKMRLLTFAESTLTKTRWAWWKPWTVVGAGMAVSAIGAGVTWKASRDYAAFDEAWFNECGGLGCFEEEQEALIARLDSADTLRTVGQGVLILGGATLITSVALLALNRPQAYLDESAGGADIEIKPLVSPDGAGVTAGFRF